MEYRTVIVVDGANNLVECHLNLMDYSSRQGEASATEKFVDLELTASENRRLQLAIGDIIASRCSQKGIAANLDQEEVTGTVVTGATWDNNTLNFQFGQRPQSEGSLMVADIPILSCPFMTALRKLDDMTAEEKQKVLEVVDMRRRLPFRFPQGDFDFTAKRQPSKELAAEVAMPNSPLTDGWSAKAKRERSKLTISINGEEEPDVNGYSGCAYGNGGLTCPRPKKRNQVYCGHHLRLVSHKHQKSRAMKRSRSSIDLGDDENDQDPDYAGLE